METRQNPSGVTTGRAPRLSQSLPAGWGSPGSSGTRLRPGTETNTSTGRHRASPRGRCGTHGQKQWLLLSQCGGRRCAKAPAGQHIPKDGNEFDSIAAAASLLSQPAGTAAVPQQLPWADGRRAAPERSPGPSPQVLGSFEVTTSSPSSQPISGLPVCWGTSSSGFLALTLPAVFLSCWVKSIQLPYFTPTGT